MRVRWTERARAHLLDVFEYIAADDPRAARALLQRIRAATDALRTQPRIGRMVPEVGHEAVRERIVPPYRIVYVVEARAIDVIGVYHSKRDLAALLRRR